MSLCHTVILMIPALLLVFKTFFRFWIPQIQRDIPEYRVYFYPFCPPVSEAVLAPSLDWRNCYNKLNFLWTANLQRRMIMMSRPKIKFAIFPWKISKCLHKSLTNFVLRVNEVQIWQTMIRYFFNRLPVGIILKESWPRNYRLCEIQNAHQSSLKKVLVMLVSSDANLIRPELTKFYSQSQRLTKQWRDIKT